MIYIIYIAVKYIKHLLYIVGMVEKSPAQFIHLRLKKDLLEKLDEFRFTQRFESRTEAIHWLLQFALGQNPTRKVSEQD